MKGIERLSEDFFNNSNVCEEHKQLNQGDKAFIIDTTLIDPETQFYAIIPVVVAAVDNRPSRFNRVYYWFIADGSKLDEKLNVQQENINGGILTFYKYLESTSPYIFLSYPEENKNGL
jgi:hypothetical protein